MEEAESVSSCLCTPILVAVAAILFVYYWIQKQVSAQEVFKDLGVPAIRPLPIVGNDLKVALGLQSVQDSQVEMYNYFRGNRIAGHYFFSLVPMVVVRDPALVEAVLIKDFSSFYDRGVVIDEKLDPLAAHLFNLSGKRWKGLRNKLSPTFTSGKLRGMHPLMMECVQVLCKVLQQNVDTKTPLDAKETMAKFTTDVIGCCAFGLQMNSLLDPDSKFRQVGRELFSPTWRSKIRQMYRLIMRMVLPRSTIRKLKMKSIPQKYEDFFFSLVRDTVKMREEQGIQRNDFIQLMMNLRNPEEFQSLHQEEKEEIEELTGSELDTTKDNQVVLDESLMAAQAFVFFLAGFETTASTLSYCLFEMSKSPDIQSKMYEEIKTVLKSHNEEPTFEAVKNLTYMEQVLYESLRKYPPVPFLQRIATQDYKVPGTNITIPKGMRLEIPVYPIHHDPDIHPNPEKFDPDRFSPENKAKIPPGAYMPFGMGPRICIGARFAWMELKVALSKMILNYTFTRNEQTPEKLVFSKKSPVLLIPEGGIWLNVERRIQS